MIVYEYFCKTCEKNFESEHPMGEAPIQAICSKCGLQNSRRIFSLRGFNIYGGGTYQAESRKESILGKEKYAKHRHEDPTR